MNRKTFGSTALVLALLLAVTTLGFSPAALASGDRADRKAVGFRRQGGQSRPTKRPYVSAFTPPGTSGGRGRERCRPAGLAGSAGCFGYHRDDLKTRSQLRGVGL